MKISTAIDVGSCKMLRGEERREALLEAFELEVGDGDIEAGRPEEEHGDGEENDNGDAKEEVPAEEDPYHLRSLFDSVSIFNCSLFINIGTRRPEEEHDDGEENKLRRRRRLAVRFLRGSHFCSSDTE
nr:hypothetical protein Iba_scaffold48126CG0010 [Ipomoea batatas]